MMERHLSLRLKDKMGRGSPEERQIRLRYLHESWSLPRKAAGVDHGTLRWQRGQGHKECPEKMWGQCDF